MAILKGVNKTKIDAGGSGTNVIDQGEFAGTVKSVYDTIELTAAASGDTIEIATPPAGSKIVGVTMAFDDLGAGTTISMGDTNTAALYLAATDVATAAGVTSAIAIAGVNYEIGTTSGDEEIILTIGGSAATGTVKTIVEYV
jgi:hypothetical protein